MKNIVRSLLLGCVAGLFATGAGAAPVDLSSWVAEGAGTWNLQAGNNSVLQTVNGQPTVFHNNSASSHGQQLSGTIRVQTTSDDDFIGFVLGFNAGDLTKGSTDYLLVDWKQGNQSSGGCLGAAGIAVSRVSGPINNNPWCHTGNVSELQRGANLGSTGWADNTTYTFDLIFTSSVVQVFVDGVKEIDISGTFADGGFGFYNYSQQSVLYAGIQQQAAPQVPVPAGILLMGTVLGGAGFIARRTRKA